MAIKLLIEGKPSPLSLSRSAILLEILTFVIFPSMPAAGRLNNLAEKSYGNLGDSLRNVTPRLRES